jgi:hypothetical protein
MKKIKVTQKERTDGAESGAQDVDDLVEFVVVRRREQTVEGAHGAVVDHGENADEELELLTQVRTVRAAYRHSVLRRRIHRYIESENTVEL